MDRGFVLGLACGVLTELRLNTGLTFNVTTSPHMGI